MLQVDRKRVIEVTHAGRESLDKARQDTTDLGMLVRGLRMPRTSPLTDRVQ